MKQNLSLFAEKFPEDVSEKRTNHYKPLAESLRPKTWQDFVGLENIEGDLIKTLKGDQRNPPSLIFWGPPGSGKTTLAKILGENSGLNFVELSAVLGGLKTHQSLLFYLLMRSIDLINHSKMLFFLTLKKAQLSYLVPQLKILHFI